MRKLVDRIPKAAAMGLAVVLGGLFGERAAQAAEVTISFDQTLQSWDGFGANYVEVRHTRDYRIWPQDYGGFKYLTQAQRDEVIDLVFGDEGLRVSLLKMFLDPYHEPTPDNDDPNHIAMSGYDHVTTTRQMCYFAQQGLSKTRARGEDLTILAGLYAAPAWAIQQGDWGRDLIPAQEEELAEYLVSWAKYLQVEARLPVRHLSLHNEEANTNAWNDRGFPKKNTRTSRQDRALFWPKQQIVDFVVLVRNRLDAEGLCDISVTPGETKDWGFFEQEGIPDAILADPGALNSLGLITSHGFMRPRAATREFHPEYYRGDAIEKLRAARPQLHAWTTSCKLDGFVKDTADIGYMEQMRLQIYETRVNGIIPWAILHCRPEADRVMDGSSVRSGNSNSPIHVIPTSATSGHYEIRKGYYFYKQLTRAGRPGMLVAQVHSDDDDIRAIAFAKGDTNSPDSFLVLNLSGEDRQVDLRISGTAATRFAAVVTSEASASDKDYQPLGTITLQQDHARCVVSAKSSLVFFGQNRP